METIRTPAAMTDWSRRQMRQGRTIALVPTMGYFHEGHLSLMRMAAEHGDRVVVSLFVNPIQFGPAEDLGSYPRDFDRDRQLAEVEGVDILFAPEAGDMYPEGFQTTVSVGALSTPLCGASRPGHFNGVTTVVSKLFHIVRPDVAVFGAKDFQQLAVIRRMVLDLNMGVRIQAHPVVREADGLAMSSRNTYLDESQRDSALSLFRAITRARELFSRGEHRAEILLDAMRSLIRTHPGTRIDYVSLVDPLTLQDVQKAEADSRVVLAVTIDDRIRLIDNGSLGRIE